MPVWWMVLFRTLSSEWAQLAGVKMWIRSWAQRKGATSGKTSSMRPTRSKLTWSTRGLVSIPSRKRKAMILRVDYCKKKRFKLRFSNKKSVTATSWSKLLTLALAHTSTSIILTILRSAKAWPKSERIEHWLNLKEWKLAFSAPTPRDRKTVGLMCQTRTRVLVRTIFSRILQSQPSISWYKEREVNRVIQSAEWRQHWTKSELCPTQFSSRQLIVSTCVTRQRHRVFVFSGPMAVREPKSSPKVNKASTFTIRKLSSASRTKLRVSKTMLMFGRSIVRERAITNPLPVNTLVSMPHHLVSITTRSSTGRVLN